MSDFALYGYFRSSAAFRARIALNLKGIKPELRFIHLLKDGGQQHTAEYKALNPQELIPALVHEGHTIAQSLAIIEYLDEIVPEPPFLPKDAYGRARCRDRILPAAHQRSSACGRRWNSSGRRHRSYLRSFVSASSSDDECRRNEEASRYAILVSIHPRYACRRGGGTHVSRIPNLKTA